MSFTIGSRCALQGRALAALLYAGLEMTLEPVAKARSCTLHIPNGAHGSCSVAQVNTMSH